MQAISVNYYFIISYAKVGCMHSLNMKCDAKYVTGGGVVDVFLPRPMEGIRRLQFSDLFTELPVPPQAAGVVGTF